MAGELFGPFRDIPLGAKVLPKGSGSLTGIPIPNLSLTGGAAGPSQALSSNGNVNVNTGTNFLNLFVIGIIGIAGMIVWKKIK